MQTVIRPSSPTEGDAGTLFNRIANLSSRAVGDLSAVVGALMDSVFLGNDL